MKVKMLLKSGFGPIHHGEVFDATPEDALIGIRAGVLAPVETAPPNPSAHPGKSFTDFCRAVVRNDAPYLARNYHSHLVLPETDHLSPQAKAALAESGGPTGGYTVPAEYAAGMLTVSRRESNSPAAGPRRRCRRGRSPTTEPRCRCCAERARPARPFDTATAGRPAETRHPCGPLSLRRPGTSPGMKRAISNGPRRQSGAGRAPRPTASVVIGQSHVIR